MTHIRYKKCFLSIVFILLLLTACLPNPLLANFIYVANQNSQNVSVINSETNTVIATILMPPGSHPESIAITPDGKLAYVTNGSANSVSVIDTSTQTLVGSPIPITTSADGIAITPNGAFAYVTGGVQVTVIDLATNSVTGSPINVLPSVGAIAISPEGNFAYVVQPGVNRVAIIGIPSNTLVTTILVGTTPQGIVFTPDGKFAYVTNTNSNTVSIIDTSTQTVISPFTIAVDNNPLGIAITPDGKFLYVAASGSPAISVINTQTNIKVASITAGLPSVPVQIAITPDGTLAYVTHELVSGLVSIISTQTNTVVGSSIIVGTFPFGIAITPPPQPVIIVPPPPTNFRGCQFKNDLGLQFEFYNQLTWQFTPSPDAIQGFYLFRNGKRIATLGPNARCFLDHNQCKGAVTTYSLVSFDANGNQSQPVFTKIFPFKKD